MKKVFLSFIATAFLLVASVVSVKAQTDSGTVNTQTETAMVKSQIDVVETANGTADFSKLSEAIKTSGLTDRLKTGGPYTIFAPNNAAFERMSADDFNKLMKNKNALSKVVTTHIVGGTWNASLLMTAIKQNNGTVQLPTMSGGKLTATVEEGKVKLTDENGNSAYIINTDITASNGIIHVIDGVVQPMQQTVTKKN